MLKLTIQWSDDYGSTNTIRMHYRWSRNFEETGLASVDVTQASDISAIWQLIVDAYTGADFISTQYQQDSDGKPGVLASDSTLRMVQNQLRDSLTLCRQQPAGS